MLPPKRASRWYCSIPITGLAQASTRPKQFIGLNLYPPRAQQPSQQELIDRLIFIQANESAKCYQENIVRSVADANIGAIFGWGFAPHHGGTLQFINAMGLEAFITRSCELAEQYGERFQPAQIVLDMAAKGEVFSDD